MYDNLQLQKSSHVSQDQHSHNDAPLQEMVEALSATQLQATARTAGGSAPSCSDAILSDARQAVLACANLNDVHTELARLSPAGKLQPSLRKALSIVEHPDAFLDGFVPAGTKERSGTTKRRTKRKRRGRKRRQMRPSGVAGLEQRAVQDSSLHFALHEFKWGNSICSHALNDLAPKQTERAASVLAQPLGFQSRTDPAR